VKDRHEPIFTLLSSKHSHANLGKKLFLSTMGANEVYYEYNNKFSP